MISKLSIVLGERERVEVVVFRRKTQLKLFGIPSNFGRHCSLSTVVIYFKTEQSQDGFTGINS